MSGRTWGGALACLALWTAGCACGEPMGDAGIDGAREDAFVLDVPGIDASLADTSSDDSPSDASDVGADDAPSEDAAIERDTSCTPPPIDGGSGAGPVVLHAGAGATAWPTLVAVSEGGPYRAITGSGGEYDTGVATGPYTLVWVCVPAPSYVRVVIRHALAEEGRDVDGSCYPQRDAPPVMVRGTVSGLTAGREAFVLGGSPRAPSTRVESDGSYGLPISGGIWDVVVDERDPVTLRSLRMDIARAVDLRVARIVDFDLAAGFDVEEWPVDVVTAPAESIVMGSTLWTAGGGRFSLEVGGVGPPSGMFRTIPADRTVEGDLQAFALGAVGANTSRSITHYARNGSALTLRLLPVFDVTVTVIERVPSLRLRSTFDDSFGTTFGFGLSRSGLTIDAVATRGWLAASCADGQYETPDLFSVPGWNPAWTVTSGPSALWGASAADCPGSGPDCSAPPRDGVELRSTGVGYAAP